jgi:hypothetical protein
MKKLLYVVLPLFMASALRLYPTFISGLPFSTDAWSPIRNTELLMEYTPIHIGDDEVFDGYNNYWPGNSLFGAVVSRVTGLEPMYAMAVFLPLTGSISILIFYVLVKRLYNAKVSFMASIIFGTAFTHVFFTAGVTKETYANPLYFLLIFIFLHPTIGRRKQALLFAITSVTLALTHHLTPLITIAILSSIALARFINNTKKSLAPNKSDFVLVAILTVTTAVYYLLYAQAGFKFPLTLSDWLSAASYQTLAFASAMYLTSKPYAHVQTRTLIVASGTIALAPLFILLTMNIPPAGFPTLPKYCLLYLAPYFIILPFITFGYSYHRIKGSIAPPFWLATLMGLEAYAIFSNSSLSPVLWIRTPNFLYPPLAILSAAGLYWLYETAGKTRLRKLIKPAVMTVVLVIAIINAYTLYAAVSLQERYMGYHWLYRAQEYQAGAWTGTASSSPTVAGDMKVLHLMRDYFDAKVDVLQGFRYLTENGTSQPQILFVYGQMLKNGYVIGYHGVDLPENWMKKASQLNQIYSNGLASLYAG